MQNGNPNEIRRKKIIALVSTIVTAILLIVFVLIPNLVKNNQAKANYRKAIDLLNSGQYQAAAEKFEECGDYNDAQDLARQSYYAQAERFFENNDYEQAAGFYEKAGSYSNASGQYSECMYQIGFDRIDQQDNSGAAEAFIKAGIDYKDIKRHICSNAALSQTVPFSEYSLADRVIDTLYYVYGQSVISSIAVDGSIDGKLNGCYTTEGENLFVSLAENYTDENVSEGDFEYTVRIYNEDQVADAFLAFLRHVYGIDSPEITSNVKNAVQQVQEFEVAHSFHLLQEGELMASIWKESGYYIMKCGTDPIQLTPLERKGQILVDAINQAAGKSMAYLQFVEDEQKAYIFIRLLFTDGGDCFVTGTYDESSDAFTISTIELTYEIGVPTEERSSYLEELKKIAPVVYGIVEGTFGLSIDSTEKTKLSDSLSLTADTWYRKVSEGMEEWWDEQTDSIEVNLAGLPFNFMIDGGCFRGELECSGYRF